MDEARIDAFIDGLRDPEGFLTPRAAIAQHVPGLLTARGSGAEAWMAMALDAVVEHLRNDAQPPGASAIVQSAHACYVLDQGCCEHAGWFIDRVAEEALAVREPWVAVVVPDSEAAGVPLAQYNALNLPEQVRVERLRWYVEMRSASAAGAFGGVASLRDDEAFAGAAVRPREAAILGRVLRGHPDRRRFRTRPLQRG